MDSCNVNVADSPCEDQLNHPCRSTGSWRAPQLDLTGTGAPMAPSGTKADLALTSWMAWKPSHFSSPVNSPGSIRPARMSGSCSRENSAVHGVERQLVKAFRTTPFGASHHGASLATCKKFPLRRKSASSKVTSPRRYSHTGSGTQSTHWNMKRRVQVTQGTAFQANMFAAHRLSQLAMTPGVLFFDRWAVL